MSVYAALSETSRNAFRHLLYIIQDGVYDETVHIRFYTFLLDADRKFRTTLIRAVIRVPWENIQTSICLDRTRLRETYDRICLSSSPVAANDFRRLMALCAAADANPVRAITTVLARFVDPGFRHTHALLARRIKDDEDDAFALFDSMSDNFVDLLIAGKALFQTLYLIRRPIPMSPEVFLQLSRKLGFLNVGPILGTCPPSRQRPCIVDGDMSPLDDDDDGVYFEEL